MSRFSSHKSRTGLTIPVLLKSAIHRRMLLLLPALFIASACATTSTDLVEAGRMEVKLSENAAPYVKKVGVYKDDRGMFIRGRIFPANRSHIPKPFSGHIDVLVETPGEREKWVGKIDLRSRQDNFTYHLPSVVAEGSVLIIDYSKSAHQRREP